ncbi:AraC family transcriptional regulator, partial [Herbaspirillum sp.]|uniref:helix-turn-helix transcriptional regulator n=1 Tax=Herbaspirillum sp. TaxID=1890675 RepID=UPI0031D368DC
MTSKASAQASRAEYTRRMNRVLNYIDAHLDQPLDGAELADVANFSRFHFHRIFAAIMGETLGSYARRRRLEKAAFRLSCGNDETVLETALATGFGSAEAFARGAATLALVMVLPFGGRAPVVEQHATERGEREAVKLADG